MSTRKLSPGRRAVAAVLSLIAPGLGQLSVGRYRTGFRLLLAAVAAAEWTVMLAGSADERRVLPIVLLALSLPALCYWSVYDLLQSTARTPAGVREFGGFAAGGQPAYRQQVGLTEGLELLAFGAVLLLPRMLPEPGERLFHVALFHAPGICLLIWAGRAAFGMLSGRKGKSMYRLGRVTASVVAVVTGVLLLWDAWTGGDRITLLGRWWPAAIMLLGLETIIMTMVIRSKRPAFDFGGVLLAGVVAAVSYGVSQYGGLPTKWIDQLQSEAAVLSGYGEEAGYRYDLPAESAERSADIQTIVIENRNGRVVIREGDGTVITAQAELWVNTKDEAEAERTAAESRVLMEKDGGELIIKTEGKPFGSLGNVRPRINLIVTLPAGDADLPDSPGGWYTLETSVVNGSVEAEGLSGAGRIEIDVVSGGIQVRDFAGSLEATTGNGDIKVMDLAGSAELDTLNGSITAARITGDLIVSTANGRIVLEEITGDIEADTKNGDIAITEVHGAVSADTLNGRIVLSSSVVGGDWNLGSAVGEIEVRLPEDADAEISGSVTFGNIETDLPLEIGKKTIKGRLGEGRHRVLIDTNGSIAVLRRQQ